MVKSLLKSFSITLLIIFLIMFVYIIFFQESKLIKYETKRNTVSKRDLEIAYNEPTLETSDMNNTDLNNFVSCYKSPIKYEDFTMEMKAKYDEINNLFNSSADLVSFSYEDLYTGLHISYNEEQEYFVASTIKAAVVLYVYELYVNGQLDLNEVMTYTSNYFVEGSGSIQNEPVGSQYTIKELIRRTIVESDNIAYQMLCGRVYNTDIRNYWNSLGATTFWKNNSIWNSGNSKDGAIYMKQIYKFTEAHPELKSEILNLFFNSVARSITLDDPNVMIAHKSGWNSATLHDLAIVYDSEPYILTINSLKGYSDYQSFFHNASQKINEFHRLYWDKKAEFCYTSTFK